CTYFIAYRFYALFISSKVLRVDANRPTPALRRNDGLDYVPTNKYVLFGHHFATIAGAVQDMIVLFISTRRDGRSLGEIIRLEMGPIAGVIGLIGVLLIMIILLAVLALVVVKALAESPWGTFAVFATIPIAVLMGIYGRFIRPGRVSEMSFIGLMLLV